MSDRGKLMLACVVVFVIGFVLIGFGQGNPDANERIGYSLLGSACTGIGFAWRRR
jgi:hypothetical protein